MPVHTEEPLVPRVHKLDRLRCDVLGLPPSTPVPGCGGVVRRDSGSVQHPAAHQGASVPEQLRHQQTRRHRLASEHKAELLLNFKVTYAIFLTNNAGVDSLEDKAKR